MIKRDGVAVMNARSGNVAIAKETIEILKAKSYIAPSGKTVDISQSLDFAINWTMLYPGVVPEWEEALETSTPTIEVTNETTAVAGARLITEGKPTVIALNFASARNQGGGFLSGAIAQEEDLCRASGLYACLKRKPQFYNENILCDNCFYTDNIIYSPYVPFFRDRHNQFLEEPFELSIVSAPAPNARAMDEVNEEKLYETIKIRAEKVLRVALLNDHKDIILGAWGCGAFGNNVEQVAVIFKELLGELPYFEHVCFAVYDTREPPALYETFKKVFEK